MAFLQYGFEHDLAIVKIDNNVFYISDIGVVSLHYVFSCDSLDDF